MIRADKVMDYGKNGGKQEVFIAQPNKCCAVCSNKTGVEEVNMAGKSLVAVHCSISKELTWEGCLCANFDQEKRRK